MSRKKAFLFIVLLGLVSLFADVTYEGARSIIGPFMKTLGASAAALGFAVGLGELTGYAFRLISGILSDKTRKYWLFTILGYAINLFAVPALALAGNWQTALVLIIAERFGKALRTPARDVLLSFASEEVGMGKGFGIHEALDQIGASWDLLRSHSPSHLEKVTDFAFSSFSYRLSLQWFFSSRHV